jgi:hypothetical protein
MPCNVDVPPFLARWPHVPPYNLPVFELVYGLTRGKGDHIVAHLTCLDMVINSARVFTDVKSTTYMSDVTDVISFSAAGVVTTPRELALHVFGASNWNSLSNVRLCIDTEAGCEFTFAENDKFDPISFF